MVFSYIASYGKDNDKGIYVVEIKDGVMDLKQHLETEDYPSYIIRNDNLIYTSLKNATNQNSHGGLAIFNIKEDGLLEPFDAYASSGRSYTHLCLSPNLHYLFAANYHVGTTAAYLLENHKVLKKQSVCYHEGSGPDKLGRQTRPHVHNVGITPDKKYVYSVDLGSDTIVLYQYDGANLVQHNVHRILPGSGPRHLIFSEDGKFAYLVNEIANNVMVFKYYDGRFTMMQVSSTIPRHYHGQNSASAIRLSKSGTHLFVSNRGHDSIAMYKVNKETGKLILLYMVHTKACPRDFNIYDDKFAIACCQEDNCIEYFRLDLENDILERMHQEVEIPAPVCVTFR